ncbi:MAG: hypothetical protein F6K45_22275 [Kamptonema sp. SIO1D9]|nr:hypothetical protein [Kamptonema sp. SIO1D9]
MRYQISHQTSYKYNQLVLLKPHVLRLRPRCDVGQKLHNFSLTFFGMETNTTSAVMSQEQTM